MKKPFFAKYLESQRTEEAPHDEQPEAKLEVKTGFKAGRPITTNKYPSDRDEAVTMKFPSDGDEG